MENNELINIWNALAENKLIDNNLAKEHISDIIKKKHSKVIHKIKRKVLFDCSLYLTISILVPIVTTTAMLNSPNGIELIHIIGIMACETYLVFMLLKAYSKYRKLDNNSLSTSIKENIQNLRTQYLKILKKERMTALIFTYTLLGFVFFLHFRQIGSDELNTFSTWIAPIVIIPIMLIIQQVEYKIRYKNSIKQFDDTLSDINNGE